MNIITIDVNATIRALANSASVGYFKEVEWGYNNKVDIQKDYFSKEMKLESLRLNGRNYNRPAWSDISDEAKLRVAAAMYKKGLESIYVGGSMIILEGIPAETAVPVIQERVSGWSGSSRSISQHRREPTATERRDQAAAEGAAALVGLAAIGLGALFSSRR